MIYKDRSCLQCVKKSVCYAVGNNTERAQTCNEYLNKDSVNRRQERKRYTSMPFEIMFSDLNTDAQNRFLAYMEMSDPSEGNYDVFPIAVVENNAEDDDEEPFDVFCMAY